MNPNPPNAIALQRQVAELWEVRKRLEAELAEAKASAHALKQALQDSVGTIFSSYALTVVYRRRDELLAAERAVLRGSLSTAAPPTKD